MPTKPSPRSANDIDNHLGSRLRERRKELGLSQVSVGEATGVTFQQIQKYELGTNRIAASRLYLLAKTLEVPLDYFFEGVDDG